MTVAATGSTYEPNPIFDRKLVLQNDIDRLQKKINKKKKEIRVIDKIIKKATCV